MLNEFERRVLQMAENYVDLGEALVAGGQTAVRPRYFGYSGVIGSAADPFVFNVPRQVIIPIRADSYFNLWCITVGIILPNGSTNGDLSQVTMGNDMDLQITDMGSGETLYNVAAPAALLVGSPLPEAAGIPFVLRTPRLLPPNVNVLVEMTWTLTVAAFFPPPNQAWIMLNGGRVPV